MKPQVLIDTGPLVAGINRRDTFHSWVRGVLGRTPPPVLTCESVLAEACFLLQGVPRGGGAVLELVRRGVVRADFRLSEQTASVAALMVKYGDTPMSLADACLVRMSELHENSEILTLNSNFLIYRRHGRRVIPVVMPPDHV
jgi:predicted nucleic acid-binding protein